MKKFKKLFTFYSKLYIFIVEESSDKMKIALFIVLYGLCSFTYSALVLSHDADEQMNYINRN